MQRGPAVLLGVALALAVVASAVALRSRSGVAPPVTVYLTPT
jgi:hypothetical protein